MPISFGHLAHFFAPNQGHDETNREREFVHQPSPRSSDIQPEEAVVVDRRMRSRFSDCSIFNRDKHKDRDPSATRPNRLTAPGSTAGTPAAIAPQRTTEVFTGAASTAESRLSSTTAPPHNAQRAVGLQEKSRDRPLIPAIRNSPTSQTAIQPVKQRRKVTFVDAGDDHTTAAERRATSNTAELSLLAEEINACLQETLTQSAQTAAPLFKRVADSLESTSGVPPRLLRATIEAMVRCSSTWKKGPDHAEFNRQVLRVFKLTEGRS